jgi:glycosyltransferase involved in cell wall biosynthesis
VNNPLEASNSLPNSLGQTVDGLMSEADCTVDLSIIIPCFNEQQAIPIFLKEVEPILDELNMSYELVFINDGSTDETLKTLLECKQSVPQMRIINLSRNFGKEAALSAGIDICAGRAVIPIDVDLQDPPELIPKMVKIWQEKEVDVVLAKRGDRSKDTFMKRWSANLFYRFNNVISKTKIPENVGDFRLVSRRCVEAIKSMGETQRFMKGVFAWVGFKTETIEYERAERSAGEASFNAWKLWNLALEGFTSFSTAPLRIWLYIGIFAWFISIFYGSWIVIKTLIFGVDLPGYASLFTAVMFFGSTQLIVLGVLGEYIGRIYMETKGRPLYIVEKEY